MSKKTGQGHISVKGPVYWEFRRVCQSRNLAMSPTQDALIRDELDRLDLDQVTPPGSIPGVIPEQLIALFQHTFGEPKEEPKELCELMADRWESENQDHRVPVYAEAVAESITGELSKPGLFSAEGLKAAVPSPRREQRTARGTEPTINADDLPSCIDTTFGKK